MADEPQHASGAESPMIEDAQQQIGDTSAETGSKPSSVFHDTQNYELVFSNDPPRPNAGSAPDVASMIEKLCAKNTALLEDLSEKMKPLEAAAEANRDSAKALHDAYFRTTGVRSVSIDIPDEEQQGSEAAKTGAETPDQFDVKQWSQLLASQLSAAIRTGDTQVVNSVVSAISDFQPDSEADERTNADAFVSAVQEALTDKKTDAPAQKEVPTFQLSKEDEEKAKRLLESITTGKATYNVGRSYAPSYALPDKSGEGVGYFVTRVETNGRFGSYEFVPVPPGGVPRGAPARADAADNDTTFAERNALWEKLYSALSQLTPAGPSNKAATDFRDHASNDRQQPAPPPSELRQHASTLSSEQYASIAETLVNDAAKLWEPCTVPYSVFLEVVGSALGNNLCMLKRSAKFRAGFSTCALSDHAVIVTLTYHALGENTAETHSVHLEVESNDGKSCVARVGDSVVCRVSGFESYDDDDENLLVLPGCENSGLPQDAMVRILLAAGGFAARQAATSGIARDVPLAKRSRYTTTPPDVLLGPQEDPDVIQLDYDELARMVPALRKVTNATVTMLAPSVKAALRRLAPPASAVHRLQD